MHVFLSRFFLIFCVSSQVGATIFETDSDIPKALIVLGRQVVEDLPHLEDLIDSHYPLDADFIKSAQNLLGQEDRVEEGRTILGQVKSSFNEKNYYTSQWGDAMAATWGGVSSSKTYEDQDNQGYFHIGLGIMNIVMDRASNEESAGLDSGFEDLIEGLVTVIRHHDGTTPTMGMVGLVLPMDSQTTAARALETPIDLDFAFIGQKYMALNKLVYKASLRNVQNTCFYNLFSCGGKLAAILSDMSTGLPERYQGHHVVSTVFSSNGNTMFLRATRTVIEKKFREWIRSLDPSSPSEETIEAILRQINSYGKSQIFGYWRKVSGQSYTKGIEDIRYIKKVTLALASDMVTHFYGQRPVAERYEILQDYLEKTQYPNLKTAFMAVGDTILEPNTVPNLDNYIWGECVFNGEIM